MSEGLCELDTCGKLDEALAECHPPSSTAIPASLPSIISPLPSSPLPTSISIPSPTFVDSIIVSVSPSPSQIQDPTPVSNSIPSSSTISTSPSIEILSILSACVDHVKT